MGCLARALPMQMEALARGKWQAREGIETTEAQADRAYYVVSEGERATFFDLER